MKAELYATKKNIKKKAEDWLSDMDRKRKWNHKKIEPALLILDMQNFFLKKESHAFIPSGEAIIPLIRVLAGTFDGPIFLTKHIHDTEGSNLMNVWWRDPIQKEMEDIIQELAGMTHKVLEKKHYSAFYGTGLEEMLKQEGVNSVMIAGVHTDLCCETTARDAFMRGFKVYFIADATATSTEERHIAALKIISQGFGEVISSGELMSLL